MYLFAIQLVPLPGANGRNAVGKSSGSRGWKGLLFAFAVLVSSGHLVRLHAPAIPPTLLKFEFEGC